MFDPVQINKLYTFIKRAKQTETTHKGRTKELRQKKLQTSSKKCFREGNPPCCTQVALSVVCNRRIPGRMWLEYPLQYF